MRHDFGTLRRTRRREEVNPMDSVANLIDAMLVLACGLMIALVLNWNVDLALEQVNVSAGKEVTNVESTEEDLEEALNPENAYRRMGILYEAPVTGKMYILTEEGRD